MLGQLLERHQQLARPNPAAPPEPPDELRCRDLAQALAQLLGEPVQTDRIQVFISHTKRAGAGDEAGVMALIEAVREIVADTHLGAFFDTNALQPGGDYDAQLRKEAGRSAFLAIRSDLYASREWCQREMLIAKAAGMPIVVLDALARGEERGSFLLDHVPRVPVRRAGRGLARRRHPPRAQPAGRGVPQRALWRHQKELAQGSPELEVAWWAPHAPEPATLALWLLERRRQGAAPPARERAARAPPRPAARARGRRRPCVSSCCSRALPRASTCLTPRMLAARGG